MRGAVEQSGGHLGIAEDGRPFAEGKVRRTPGRPSKLELHYAVKRAAAAQTGPES